MLLFQTRSERGKFCDTGKLDLVGYILLEASLLSLLMVTKRENQGQGIFSFILLARKLQIVQKQLEAVGTATVVTVMSFIKRVISSVLGVFN